jgi:DNA modification methylase
MTEQHMPEFNNQVLHTDALDFVRDLPSACCDVVCTDSPYPNGMKYYEQDIKDAKYVLSLAPEKARKRVIFFWSPMHRDDAPKPPRGWYLLGLGIWIKPDAGTKIEGEDIYVWAKYEPGVPREWQRFKPYLYPILDFRSRKDFYEHKTQKSLDMVREVLKDWTEEGDTILDPFGGTGTIGKAAKQLRRPCLTLEKDEHWATIARERIENTKPWRSWKHPDTTTAPNEEDALPQEEDVTEPKDDDTQEPTPKTGVRK